MSLYGWLILGTFVGPFMLSFDRKVHFYTYWRALFPAITLVAIIFLIWDEYFTQNGVWGFNPNYLGGLYLGSLPIEEVSFFFVVPFACVFIYEVLKAYFPKIDLRKTAKIFAFAFAFAGFLFGTLNLENWYTSTACIIAALLTLGIYYVQKAEWYGSFAFSYLVAIIPFLIVNGVLTGATTPEPVVWYSEAHIMGPRIITIPAEDLFYNYDMLLGVVFLYERFKKVSWIGMTGK